MDFGKYIAHRGLHNSDIPENSMPAFKRAAELGFTVELDVRLTKDCKMVVFHDDDLMRACGAEGKISDYTYEQLSAFTLFCSSEKIPLFKDVLKEINGRVPVLIELKRCAPWGSLEKRVSRILENYVGNYAVQSFDPFSMLWFRLFSPETKRGQLISEHRSAFDCEYVMRKICARPFIWKLLSQPDFIACDLRSVSMEALFAALDMNADFITWTAKNDELMELAEQFSKTVIFENYDGSSHDFSDNHNNDSDEKEVKE